MAQPMTTPKKEPETTPKPKAKPDSLQSFQEGGMLMMLPALERGSKLHEANTKLAELVKAVQQENLKKARGHVTIKISVEHSEIFGDPAVAIWADVTTKLPERKTNASVFYTNDEGRVSRSPISQTDFLKPAEE